MKQSLFITIFFLSSLSFLSCKKNNIIDNPVNPTPINPPPNNPPGQFTVTLISISWDTANISWTQAIDPDKDSVFYKVFVNDSLLTSNYKELNFKFKNLKELTTYSIKIVAYDSKQKETLETINFTTKKYYLKFLKKIKYGNISGYSNQSTGKMTKANNGGYIITGKTEQLGEHQKFFAVKIDTLGNEVWKKYYDYSPGNSSEIVVINCVDGYLISGDRNLFKIDNNGNLIWHNFSYTTDEIIKSISINSKGQIYTVGGVAGDYKVNMVEASISKYEQNGTKIWNKTFSPSSFDEFDDIKVISDDKIIILGMTDGDNISMDSYIKGGVTFNYDYWVLQLTGDGDLTWSKTYRDSGLATPKNIIMTKEGNYVFTGYSVGTYVIPYFYLQMIDANGSSLWTYYRNDNTTVAHSVAETNDNALIVTGGDAFSYSSAFALYKFDKAGNKLWEKEYTEFSTYLTNKTVIPTNDGGYMINCSKSKSYNDAFETDEIYIFKTDGAGEFN